MVGVPVCHAAQSHLDLLQPSLPGEPHERKVITRVEPGMRRRHSAVEEEPRDAVDQLPERSRVATADAHDVQLYAAHPVQTVGVQPRLPVVVEDGMNAEEARWGGRDARGSRVPQPVAGPGVERIHVEHRDRLRSERSQEPELGVQRVENVAPELAADGDEELAGEGCVEVPPRRRASSRYLGKNSVAFTSTSNRRMPLGSWSTARMWLPLAFCRTVTGTQARDRLHSSSSKVGGGSAAGSSAISFDNGGRATRYMNSSMSAGGIPRSFRVYRRGPTRTSVGLPAPRLRRFWLASGKAGGASSAAFALS